MATGWNRRTFVGLLPGLVAAGVAPVRATSQAPGGGIGQPVVWPGFPAQDPALVREVVGQSHSNVDRVRELVTAQPALAKATWDWGFGDWESALGAASHTGRREIAELLLAYGARPTIFSAAMLGQLDAVKAFIDASPGVQRTPGPHGITLLSHARAGGPTSAAVVTYLERIGGADERPVAEPLDPADCDAIVGEYAYGSRPSDRFVVAIDRERVALTPGEGGTTRFIWHSGNLTFHPPGAPDVRLEFIRTGDRVTQLVVRDGPFTLTAPRAR